MGKGKPGRGTAVLHHDRLFTPPPGDTVTIPLMKGISPELMQVNTNDDITRWWEVMDRTTGQPVPPEQWELRRRQCDRTGRTVP